MENGFGKTLVISTMLAGSALLTGCLTGGDVEEPGLTSSPNPTQPPSGNGAPTISGNPPPAVIVGQQYSFTPSASDPDGDNLTFSVQNLPPWASFDSSTGQVSGMAALGFEGQYDNILITVSDGSANASLAAFSVNVTAVALGSATLSWDAPTQNTDGSPLTDLSGYRIYYGTSSGDYPNRITVNNAGVTTYVVDNLLPDTYYFVATSVNATGLESTFSNEAVKVVN